MHVLRTSENNLQFVRLLEKPDDLPVLFVDWWDDPSTCEDAPPLCWAKVVREHGIYAVIAQLDSEPWVISAYTTESEAHETWVAIVSAIDAFVGDGDPSNIS